MRRRGWNLLRAAGDLGLALACFYASFWVRILVALPFTLGRLPPERLRFFEREWEIVLLAQLLCLFFLGFYDPPRPLARLELFRRLLAAVSLQGLGLMGYFFLADRTFPRSVLVVYVVLDLAGLLAWRLLLQRSYQPPVRRVVLVGAGPAAREIAEHIETHHWHGLRVAGFVPAPGEEVPGEEARSSSLGPRLGSLADLPRIVAEGKIEDVLLAGDAHSWQTRVIDSLAAVGVHRGSVLLLPGPFESLIGRMRYRWVHDIPLIEVVRESEWRIDRPLKRALDLALGSALLVLSLPLMVACALVVRLSSPGPILYRQARIGRQQRPFTLLKLRTMRTGAEEQGGELLARPGDPRLIPGGALLRRYRLDELPQLFQVLTGTMSLVGPRPERPGFVDRYLQEIPGYAERFWVAPGLTGLAQVNGEYHSSPQNKLRYDLAYIANWSIWLDLSILFHTVKIVLTSRGV